MTKTSDIKELFDQGKTVKEIKDKGFSAPLIYKVKKSIKEIVKEIVEPKPEPEPESKSEPIVEPKSNPDPLPKSRPTVKNEPSHVKKELIIDEINDESDQDIPFREFSSIDLNRDNIQFNTVDISENQENKPNETVRDIGLTELLKQVFATISVITGHDHWELDSKEQKVLKHLCKIPALEKMLRKFGLYGCVLSLFSISFKKLKTEIKMNKKFELDEKQTTQTSTTNQNEYVKKSIMEVT